MNAERKDTAPPPGASDSPDPEPGQERGRTLAGRLRLLLPLGCLGLLILVLASSWLSVRLLESSSLPSAGGSLAWSRDMGTLEPSSSRPTIVRIAAPSGDHVLPQVLSVEDALEWDRGWILLDGKSGKIHFLDPAAGQVESMGRKGPGPGEFQDPVALALQDSTLWVLNHRGTVLDRISLEDGFLARRRIQGGGCLVGLAKGLVPIGANSLFMVRLCPAALPGPGTAWIEKISPEGTLEPLVSLPLGKPGSRRIHFLRQPVLARGPAGLFLGTWDAPCFLEIGLDGKSLGSRCLPTYSRPPTPENERSKLESRFRRITNLGLFPMTIPEHLPWLDGAFSASTGLVVRRVRGMEERDLVLLRPDGTISETAGRFPEITFVGKESILAVEDLLQGTRVRIYPNPWK